MRSLAFAGFSALSLVEAAPNPIRKVVTLLQEMSEEISTELENEKKMFEKFQCYCKKNQGGLEKKNEEAAAEIQRITAEVEGLEGQKKQLGEDLKKHKKDRAAAKATLEAATKKRNADKAEFEKAAGEQKDTIEAITSAVAALEKGMGKGSFLQTESGAVAKLKKMSTQVAALADKENMDLNQQEVLSQFLQGDYHSASGEIVGILKQMKDNIDEDLGGVIAAEEAAVKAFKAQEKAQETIIASNSENIEAKTDEKGKVAVKVVEGKNAVAMLNKQLGDDQATLAELNEACKTKVEEFAVRQKDGAAEVEAIGMAIGVLNNDDALDLFRKTDTKKEAFMFIQTPVAQIKKQLDSLSGNKNAAVSLLAFSAKQALGASKVDFSKILKMIDEMSELLKKEGEDDLATRDECNADFNQQELEKREIDHAIKGLNAAIEDHEASIAEQISTIKQQVETIQASKLAQKEATEQRSTENAEYVEAVQLNGQAVELIAKAKDKLQAYYNPDLVRKQMAVETTEEAQERVLSLAQKLPGDTPEIFSGKRENKSGKSNGVMQLMDTISNDLTSDTQAREHAEKTAQAEFEKLSEDLDNQIVDSNKMKSEAEGIKAEKEEAKVTATSTLSMKTDEQANNAQTTADLHAKCDFILETFEERKAARESEIAGLTKAKAILNGANFE